ncbi:SDR family NAD(P)-dependent oxidoreductase [Patescibacteria group bacterium]|nr:SDR family NAD(P)-dependent oxidoreductase [Patescibacteria group bacterium]MBU1673759.1 SDR family NAD(P)-dependent oxidoreductase [Patescibacteria group bacterium]MBU1964099.1 SDR family NAD(P)-dependent oxidoreductase [Patescibacteria group bacterium]
MKYIIITGAARGLGQAIAAELTEKNAKLILIDKRKITATGEKIKFDLSEVNKFPELMDEISKKIDKKNAEKICLVNNAAEVIPLGIMGKLKNEELIYQINTDLLAYILLANLFIKKFANTDVKKRILNISSGAAKSIIQGAATYCGCKAGIDQFTRVANDEQKKQKFPTRVAAVTPGVVDTGMQEDLRSPRKEVFPHVNRFKAMKSSGFLQTPESTAKKICKLLNSEKFPAGKVINYYKLN